MYLDSNDTFSLTLTQSYSVSQNNDTDSEHMAFDASLVSTPAANHQVRGTSSTQQSPPTKPSRTSPKLFEKRVRDLCANSPMSTQPFLSIMPPRRDSNMKSLCTLKLHTPSPTVFPCHSCTDVPFWYGNEDSDQIQWLLQRKYSNLFRETLESVRTMMARQVTLGRRLLHFVGCVKRCVLEHDSSKQQFVTLDQIFVYQLDIAKLGATFPLYARRFARTEYTSTDGTIRKCTLLTGQQEYDECLSQIDSTHSHVSYLYQRPRACCSTSMTLDDFEFLASTHFFPETHCDLLAQAIHKNFVHPDEEELLCETQPCIVEDEDEEDEFCDAFNFALCADEMSPSPQTPPEYMSQLLSQDWNGGMFLM